MFTTLLAVLSARLRLSLALFRSLPSVVRRAMVGARLFVLLLRERLQSGALRPSSPNSALRGWVSTVRWCRGGSTAFEDSPAQPLLSFPIRMIHDTITIPFTATPSFAFLFVFVRLSLPLCSTRRCRSHEPLEVALGVYGAIVCIEIGRSTLPCFTDHFIMLPLREVAPENIRASPAQTSKLVLPIAP